jgi:cell division protein FtsB
LRMASSLPEKNSGITRQEAREEKLRKKRAKIKQHGKDLAKMYRDAVEKRTRKKEE